MRHRPPGVTDPWLCRIASAWVGLAIAASSAAQVAEAPSEAAASGAAPACLSLAEFSAHPDVAAYVEVIESWREGGLAVADYLNTDLSAVAARARDGDAAAMLVMATANMLEVAGHDGGYAVPVLLHGGKPDNSWLEDLGLDIGRLHHRTAFSDTERAQLAAARDWYYLLVTNGRLYYLHDVGKIERTLAGGPVEHGWLKHETYARMAVQHRRQFYPDVVYGRRGRPNSRCPVGPRAACGACTPTSASPGVNWSIHCLSALARDVTGWNPGSAEAFETLLDTRQRRGRCGVRRRTGSLQRVASGSAVFAGRKRRRKSERGGPSAPCSRSCPSLRDPVVLARFGAGGYPPEYAVRIAQRLEPVRPDDAETRCACCGRTKARSDSTSRQTDRLISVCSSRGRKAVALPASD